MPVLEYGKGCGFSGSDSLIMPNPMGPTGFPAMVFGIFAGAIVNPWAGGSA